MPEPEVNQFDPLSLCGWIPDGGHHEIARSMGAQELRQMAPQAMLAVEPPSPILLYKAWYDVLGKEPGYIAQQIGDCVSFGHAHANDLLQCVEKVLGEESDFSETDTEFIYGESRKISGNLGFSDGSYGAAAVKAMTRVGIVSREMLGANGVYSGKRAKSWGYSGPPDDVEKQAAPYKLGAVALIKDTPSAISALWNGSPVTICGSPAFDMTRDQDGHCRMHGTWGHCMHIAGYDPLHRRFCVCQSWGPDTPSGPTYLDQPTFSFWADAADLERSWFSEGDCWALFRAPDFKVRKFPGSWMV